MILVDDNEATVRQGIELLVGCGVVRGVVLELDLVGGHCERRHAKESAVDERALDFSVVASCGIAFATQLIYAPLTRQEADLTARRDI